MSERKLTVFRRVVIQTNNDWTEMIELARASNDPGFFIERRTWSFGKTYSQSTDTEWRNDRLDYMLKHIEQKVRHYGPRVIENVSF